MRGYFLGSGVVLAFLYLIAAAFIIRLFGIEMTHYVATLMMAAGVMLGGTYGIVMFVWLAAHVVRRLVKRQPIGEIEV
jgi:polyferredoxin